MERIIMFFLRDNYWKNGFKALHFICRNRMLVTCARLSRLGLTFATVRMCDSDKKHIGEYFPNFIHHNVVQVEHYFSRKRILKWLFHLFIL